MSMRERKSKEREKDHRERERAMRERKIKKGEREKNYLPGFNPKSFKIYFGSGD